MLGHLVAEASESCLDKVLGSWNIAMADTLRLGDFLIVEGRWLRWVSERFPCGESMKQKGVGKEETTQSSLAS